VANDKEGRGTTIARMRGALRTSLFRTSFFLLLRSGVNAGLGFVFWLVVGRLYVPTEVGYAATLLSLVLLLARIAALGLPQGILRFLPSDPDRNGLINGAFTASAIAAAVIGVVFFAGFSLWADPELTLLLVDPTMIAVLLVSLMFFALDGVLDNAFTAARRADYGLVRTTTFYTLRLPLAALFVPIGVLGIAAAWTVSLVVSILSAAILLPRFFPGYRPSLTLKGMRGRGIIGFSIWNYMTGIVAGASASLLPLIIVSRLPAGVGGEAAAYFFAAYSIATLLYAIPHSFSTSLLVEGSHANTDMPTERRRTLRYSAPLLVVGIAGLVLLGRPLLGLIRDEYATASYEALVLLALASPIMLVTGIFSSDLQVGKRVRPIFAVTTLSLVVTLMSAYFALPTFGILGVAGGVVAGQATKLLLYVSLRQIRRNQRSEPASA